MSEWDDAAGPRCPECGEETFRLIEGRCPSCYQAMTIEKEMEAEDKTLRRAYSRRLHQGTISVKELRSGRL